MHSTATYSLPRTISLARPRPAGFLTYLRAATLSIWLFMLVMRYWYLSDWFALIEEARAGVNVKGQYLTGFAIALIAHLTMGLGAWFSLPFTVLSTWSGRLFTVFCMLALFMSPLSAIPQTSAIYALGTWGVFALLCLYWENDYRITQRMVVFAGCVLLGWMYLLLLKHGLRFGSGGGAIGGMNRNTTALAAFGGMICCLISDKKWIRWTAIAAGALIAVVVTSRGTIVAMTAFFAVYYTIHKGTFRAVGHACLAIVIVSAIFLASSSIRHLVFEDIMQLHNKARGIGSGFTGRMALWKQAIDTFWDNPLLGIGFRATSLERGGAAGGVHSGYLRIFLEMGFIGGFFMIASVIIELFRRLRLGMQFAQLPVGSVPNVDVIETTRVNAVACATLAAMMTIWVYEQLYINIGSVISVVLFLMWNSPAYITTQGIGLRR